MTELKKDASEKKTTPKDEKVEKKIDIRKDLTPEEAQRLVDIENGKIIEDTVVKPDEKVDEKKKEVKPEVKEGETVVPDRYKGKTPEELVELLGEKEKYIQGRSDEIGDLRQKMKETEALKAKVDEIEANAIKQSQQPGNVPKPPVEPVISDDDFYDNPLAAYKKMLDYNKKLLEYTQQYTNAIVSPFYQSDMERKRDKLYKDLENKYKDYPVKVERDKIQSFLNKNPGYFNKYKTNAYEKAYHDISAKDFSENKAKSDEAIKEQAKKEALEEMNAKSQAGNIGLGDLGSQPISPTGKAPEYDKVKMEEDAEYNKQVLEDIEKRNK